MNRKLLVGSSLAILAIAACVGDDPVVGARPPGAQSVSDAGTADSSTPLDEPSLLLAPEDFAITQGAKSSVRLHVTRNYIDGPVSVQFEAVPSGIQAPTSVTIPADQDTIDVQVVADANATTGPAKMQATARIGTTSHTVDVPFAIRGTRGSLDRAFGNAGTAAVPSNNMAKLRDAVALADGSYIAIGTGELPRDGAETPVATLVTHYGVDGLVEPTFGGGAGTVAFLEPGRTSYYAPQAYAAACDAGKCRVTALGFDDEYHRLLDTDVDIASGAATRVQATVPATPDTQFANSTSDHLLAVDSDARLWFRSGSLDGERRAHVGRYRLDGTADTTWNGGTVLDLETLVSKSHIDVTAVQQSSTELFVLLSPQHLLNNAVDSRDSHFVLIDRQSGAAKKHLALAVPGSDLVARTISPPDAEGEVLVARASDSPCVGALSNQGFVQLSAIDPGCFSTRIYDPVGRTVSVSRLSDRRIALIVNTATTARLWVLGPSGAPELPTEGTALESFPGGGAIVRMFEDAQRRLVVFASWQQGSVPRWRVSRFWL